MAYAPNYMQGTQTAGLLNYTPQRQNFIPSVYGNQQSYIPSISDSPMYPQGASDLISGAVQGAGTADRFSQYAGRLMGGPNLSPDSLAAFQSGGYIPVGDGYFIHPNDIAAGALSGAQDPWGFSAGALSGVQNTTGMGNLSTFPGQNDLVQAAGAAAGDGSFPIAGQEATPKGFDELGGFVTREPSKGSKGGGGAAKPGIPGGLGGGYPGGLGIPPSSGPAMAGPPGLPSPISSSGVSPDLSGVPGGQALPGSVPAPGLLEMSRQSPQSSLENYFQTPGYQLMYGDQQRFQQSPGYQYAVDEALKQVQRNASSRGLLESGSVMRELTDRAQNMAMQDYYNWWDRQNAHYGDYQNRLAALSAGDTGANYVFGLGQSIGQGAMQTGSNISSILGNQGSSGFGGLTNTGAAQSNNLMNAAQMQAQINAANQSTRLAAATAPQTQRYSGLF